MTLTDATNQQHRAAYWYKYASATVFESTCAQQIAGAISAVLCAHVWLHVNGGSIVGDMKSFKTGSTTCTARWQAILIYITNKYNKHIILLTATSCIYIHENGKYEYMQG
jgi:hypothetical protein